MKNKNLIEKYFLFFALSFGAIWFGSSISKLFMSYYLFLPEELIVKESIKESLSQVLSSHLPIYVISFISFIVYFISFLIFFVVTKLKFKENGWLFVMLVIFIFQALPEIYLSTIDYKIISNIYYGPINSNLLLGEIIKRITILNGFPLINLFSFLAIVFLFVFKPLEKKSK